MTLKKLCPILINGMNRDAGEVGNHDENAARNVLTAEKCTHVNDITPRNFVEVCVDMKQQGVGGYDSWGARPEPGSTNIPANRNYNGASQ